MARGRLWRRASLLFRIALGVVVLLIAFAVVAALEATKAEPEQAEIRESVTTVRVTTVQRVPVDRWWSGYGTARALRSVDLSVEVNGVIVDRPSSIDEGVPVNEGDLILQLDDRDYTDRLASVRQGIASIDAELDGIDVEEESLNRSLKLAEESVRLLRSELNRTEEALERGGANIIEVERLQRQVSIAERDEQAIRERLLLLPSRRQRLQASRLEFQAEERLAQLNVERTRIAAPFTGQIHEVMVDRGEFVMMGTRIARLVDPDRIEIPLRMPVSGASQFAVGSDVELRARGASDVWTGTVSRIAPEADPLLRTIEVFVEVDQSDVAAGGETLRPGQFVSGRLFVGRDVPAFVVPRGAISNDRVMVVGDDGRATGRDVEVSHYIEASYPSLDPIETQWAVVAAGLSAGDRVIAANSDQIEHGTLVQIAEPAPTPSGDAP